MTLFVPHVLHDVLGVWDSKRYEKSTNGWPLIAIHDSSVVGIDVSFDALWSVILSSGTLFNSQSLIPTAGRVQGEGMISLMSSLRLPGALNRHRRRKTWWIGRLLRRTCRGMLPGHFGKV